MVRFNDGVNIDTSGPPRILRLSDGFYVIGDGMCCPCNDRKEAIDILADFQWVHKDLKRNPPRECEHPFHYEGGPIICPRCKSTS